MHKIEVIKGMKTPAQTIQTEVDFIRTIGMNQWGRYLSVGIYSVF